MAFPSPKLSRNATFLPPGGAEGSDGDHLLNEFCGKVLCIICPRFLRVCAPHFRNSSVSSDMCYLVTPNCLCEEWLRRVFQSRQSVCTMITM